MNTIDRTPTTPLITTEPLVSATNAIVTVDSPKPVEVNLAQRVDRALALSDALFAKTKNKGTPAYHTLTSALDRAAGTVVVSGGVLTGIGTLVAGIIAMGDPTIIPLSVMAGLGGAALSAGGLFTNNAFMQRFVSSRALNVKSLGSLTEAYAKADDVDKAVIGELARAWIARLDQRHVVGEFARRQLNEIAKQSESVPDASRAIATSVIAVAYALRDTEGGKYTVLSKDAAEYARRAVLGLPEDLRGEASAYLLAKLYRNEVARLKVPDDKARDACKQLLATLVANVPMPSLAAPPKQLAIAGPPFGF